MTWRVWTKPGLSRRAPLLVACLLAGLLATACTGRQGTTRTPQTAPAPPNSASGRVPKILQVMPAAYQLSAPIAREVVLARGQDLLIAGGLTLGQASTAALTLLDPVTGRISHLGRLASAAHDSAGAVLTGRAVVFGGGITASTATVQAVTRPGVAKVAGRLPHRRSDLAAVTVHGVAYLIGGYDGASYADDVIATRDGRDFTTLTTLPVPVRYPGVAAIGDQIWVFGGQTRAGITDVVQQIDLSTGHARVAGRLPHPLAGETGFTLGGMIFLAGGQTALAATRPGSGSASAALVTSRLVLRYDPASGATSPAGRLPVPVAHAAGAVIGGTAFLIGGEDRHRLVPAVTTLRLVSPGSALPPVSAGAGVAAAVSGNPSASVPPAGSLLPPASPWLAPAHGPGRLAPGSDPSVLPTDVLIADHLNNRLVIVDPQGRIRWRFPRRGDLARGQTFLVPDDAFFSPDGRYIIATQEDDQVISVIDVATRKIVYRYGTPGVPGVGPNRVDNPDDAMIAPDGDIVLADIKNCRILMVRPPSHRPLRVIGQGTLCLHEPPEGFGSPNGTFPMTNGKYLVTEINGDWTDEVSLTGRVGWSTHPPGVAYPSDTNEIYPGRYLTADYSSRGQVVEFNARGRLLWRFGGLNHPSLALPLPNGDIMVNDDFNNRVIVIDPVARRIVWQYGHTGTPGTAPGYLNDPDGVDLVPPDSMLTVHAPTMGRP
jgi:hypothetical protein